MKTSMKKSAAPLTLQDSWWNWRLFSQHHKSFSATFCQDFHLLWETYSFDSLCSCWGHFLICFLQFQLNCHLLCLLNLHDHYTTRSIFNAVFASNLKVEETPTNLLHSPLLWNSSFYRQDAEYIKTAKTSENDIIHERKTETNELPALLFWVELLATKLMTIVNRRLLPCASLLLCLSFCHSSTVV